MVFGIFPVVEQRQLSFTDLPEFEGVEGRKRGSRNRWRDRIRRATKPFCMAAHCCFWCGKPAATRNLDGRGTRAVVLFVGFLLPEWAMFNEWSARGHTHEPHADDELFDGPPG